jgi:predicted anti-sigma-YlaC factor YlaD
MPVSGSPYLLYTASASGVFAAGLGINALLNPRGALAMWGFPHPGAVPSSSEDVSTQKIIDTPEGKLADSLMMLYGSRTLVLGVGLLSTSYWGSHKACTAMVWGSTFVALMDGFVSKKVIDGSEWSHWGFVSL